MSNSYRYDPDDPDTSYEKKVSANDRRRTRQGQDKLRTGRYEEFNAGINSAVNLPDTDYDDYSYETTRYQRYTAAA